MRLFSCSNERRSVEGFLSPSCRCWRDESSASNLFFFSRSPLIYFQSWLSMLNLSLISPEYCEIADLPVFLFSAISLRTFCFSLTNFLLSFVIASLSAFSLLSTSLKASLLGFSSNFFGFSGGTVSRVTSFLFQLKVGRGLRGGYSFRGRAGGFFSSCLGRSCSNLDWY